jgi:sugar O-acyltransferase (sialic acid O-acetyltransferase NeuD family)
MQMLIYGSKIFALTVAELVKQCGHQAVGMVDDFNKGPGILGNFEEVSQNYSQMTYGFGIAIGYNNLAARWTAWNRVMAFSYQTPSLVHPSAYVADSAIIGKGVMVMAGATVDVRAKIDDLAVVWPGACVNHDSHIGRNTFISPNATICGCSIIGDHSFIGSGSVVTNHSKVPLNSIIKALERFDQG